MLRFLFGPRWLAWHAALVVVLVAFTMLGLWQLDHFEHHAPSHADQAVVVIDDVTRPGGRLTSDDAARRVRAQGAYDGVRTVFVPGRVMDGRTGYLVVSPLRTGSGVLAVLRGWVGSRSSDAATAPSGTVTVSGRLQVSESREQSTVDPLKPLPGNEIPYLGTVSLLDVWPYAPERLYDGYILLTSEQPAAARAPAHLDVKTPSSGVARWRNLAYALQWWIFGAAAIFFWGAVIRHAVAEARRQ